MRPASSGNSRPALARNLTPPRKLVAELTSAFLCAELGVQGELRHSGYIGHWIKLLKSDPRAIFTAASKASQAADYLRSLSEARNEVPCLG
jgi:antirestriction protein ArdC